METLLAYTCGFMVAIAVYQLLSRNLLRLLFGFILLGNAINLAILASGGLTPGLPPLIEPDATVLTDATANPLPQALILTAIVIGFGLVTFAFVLVYRGYVRLGSLNSDALRVAEPMTSAKLETSVQAKPGIERTGA